MPLYDLKCMNPACEYEYEKNVGLDAFDKEHCPRCGWKVERLITLVTPRHLSWSTWRAKLEG